MRLVILMCYEVLMFRHLLGGAESSSSERPRENVGATVDYSTLRLSTGLSKYPVLYVLMA